MKTGKFKGKGFQTAESRPPIPSPSTLIEAAKPGPPLNEKEIKTLQNNYDKRFDWGFKGTHKLPEDYATREGRQVLTPPHWRHVGIKQVLEGYAVVQIASHVAFTATDFRMLGMPEDTRVIFQTLAGAKAIGGEIENSTVRLLREREQSKSSAKKRAA